MTFVPPYIKTERLYLYVKRTCNIMFSHSSVAVGERALMTHVLIEEPRRASDVKRRKRTASLYSFSSSSHDQQYQTGLKSSTSNSLPWIFLHTAGISQYNPIQLLLTNQSDCSI